MVLKNLSLYLLMPVALESELLPCCWLKPIAFALRTFLPAENRYAQIEKESLASVSCDKFNKYLQGLPHFKFLTNHKPLVPWINGSDLNAIPV